jgi:hypothetical protein
MADDTYTAPAWDSADNSDFQSGPSSYHHPVRLVDSQESSPPPNPPPSQPRSSTDSIGRSWRDSQTVGGDNRESVDHPNANNDSATLVDASFDENVLRSLCELDVRGC